MLATFLATYLYRSCAMCISCFAHVRGWLVVDYWWIVWDVYRIHPLHKKKLLFFCFSYPSSTFFTLVTYAMAILMAPYLSGVYRCHLFDIAVCDMRHYREMTRFACQLRARCPYVRYIPCNSSLSIVCDVYILLRLHVWLISSRLLMDSAWCVSHFTKKLLCVTTLFTVSACYVYDSYMHGALFIWCHHFHLSDIVICDMYHCREMVRFAYHLRARCPYARYIPRNISLSIVRDVYIPLRSR
jgi:hypothetical protein